MKTPFKAHAILGLITIGALCTPASVRAASQTWNSDGSSANWDSTTNWGGNTAPGATSGSVSTDVATFNSAVGTVGTSGNPIVIDANRNIYELSFSGAPGSFTIGSAAGNTLKITSGGRIIINSAMTNTSLATQTVNAPMDLYGSLTLTNNSANGSGTGSGLLSVGGNIKAATSSPVTLTLRGSNTNNNVVSGTISNGTSSALSLTKTDSGLWRLTGTNSFTGNVLIYAGTLVANSIANSGVDSALGAGSSISLGQNSASVGMGTLSYAGSTASSNRTITIANGASGGAGTIAVTTAGQTLTLSGNVSASNTSAASTLRINGVGNGVLSGTITGTPNMAITKEGTGTWTFSAANTYSGITTVSAGTLLINGDQSLATGNVTVSNSGTVLGGSGDIGGATVLGIGTKLSAGSATGLAGELTFHNGLDLSAASNNSGAYIFDLGAVATSDMITITSGTLSLGTLDATDFSFNLLAGFGNGEYTLFAASSTISGSIGTSTINFAGDRTGTLSIDDVNNRVLLTVVPEPSAAALFGGAGMMLFLFRRKRC